jgi:excisionase family DNA binding protein
MSRSTFFTIREAAAQSRLSERTLRRAIVARQLQAVYPGGRRRVLIPSDALHAFMYLTDARAAVPVDPAPHLTNR